MRGRNDGGQSKRPIVLFWAMVVCLCFLFLYFSGSNGHTRSAAIEYGTKFSRSLGWGSDADGDDGPEESIFGTGDANDVKPRSFPVCDDQYSELIPCLDRNMALQTRLKLDLNLMEHYERHCPLPERRFNCLIPPPHGYKVPIKWPKSRDVVWKANIPHTHLAKEKKDQNWMTVAGEKIKFPGGGTHFHHGADKYISNIANMLNFKDNSINNEGMLRTVLDVGCGVASFGGYLLSSNVISMSLAPNDVHENQIQFALERGIPAYLGVLGTKRLPYPSRSFELAHCSRCRIDWLQRDGILMLELDRLLRPGEMHRDEGSGLAPWPARLTTPPPRLADLYVTADTFEKDTEMWQQRVDNYWKLFRPKVKQDSIRNIMDMKANFGSFAAALKEKDVWVMNVVPHDGPRTLKIIYDRGLIGSTHDCSGTVEQWSCISYDLTILLEQTVKLSFIDNM
ncbi:hypothetical protein ACQ4PT_047622 [Festuca glaucescens]